MLSVEEKEAFLQSIAASGVNGQGVSLSSDAFFPFRSCLISLFLQNYSILILPLISRDSIDQASKRGVRFVAQPGISFLLSLFFSSLFFLSPLFCKYFFPPYTQKHEIRI